MAKHGLRVFKNMVLRNILRHMMEEEMGGWGDCIMGTPCFSLIVKYYSGDPIETNGMDKWMRNVTFMGRGKACTRFWWGNVRETTWKT